MLKLYNMLFFISCIFIGHAYATDDAMAKQIRYKEQMVNTLKEEIQQIDSEMDRCQKAKKGWIAATVIGGVGVAATGTAAIVQATKAKQNKDDKKDNESGDKKKKEESK